MADMDPEAYAGLVELLRDAEKCARLTQWEEEFLSDMRDRTLIHAASTRVSDRQWEILKRIEGKVYA